MYSAACKTFWLLQVTVTCAAGASHRGFSLMPAGANTWKQMHAICCTVEKHISPNLGRLWLPLFRLMLGCSSAICFVARGSVLGTQCESSTAEE